MQIKKVKIGDIRMNPDNPRIIKDYKFKQLVKSIKEFPEMLEIRPIVVNEDNIILGGNMRYKACQDANIDEVYIIKAKDLNEEQQKEFLIKDNAGFGEWDWDILANEWDTEKLNEWGLDLPILNEKLQVSNDAEPEIVITEEILEEHNYVVFTFDNTLDWQVAKEIFNIESVVKPGYTETYMQKGIGRVKKGKDLLDIIRGK
jgi:hypothetical protein